MTHNFVSWGPGISHEIKRPSLINHLWKTHMYPFQTSKHTAIENKTLLIPSPATQYTYSLFTLQFSNQHASHFKMQFGTSCLLGENDRTQLILVQIKYYYYYSTTHCSLLGLIVQSGLDVPTFATRRLHVRHHARAPSGGRWNRGREMSGNFA